MTVGGMHQADAVPANAPAELAAALKRASALVAGGDLSAARTTCAGLAASVDDGVAARAHLILATCAQRAGDPALARRHVESALARNPQDALAHFSLADIDESRGAKASAIAGFERAAALSSGFAAAHHRLGILLGEAGEAERALAAFERAVAAEPANARAWNNLGHTLRTLGRIDAAGRAFERAVALKPDYELAVANLAVHWRDAGEMERAESLLRAALARPRAAPPLRALVVALAGLLRDRGALDESELLYRQAIAQAPQRSAGEWFNLGLIHAERDEPDRVRAAFASGAAGGDLRSAVAARLSLPMIYDSVEHVDEARSRYLQGLQRLNEDVDALVRDVPADRVLDGLRWTNFFLAYQGRDDRALQASYGAFVSRALSLAAPQWLAPMTRRASRPRVRVGFASAFFHLGTAGQYFRSWITDLDRERFEVFVYHLFPGTDEIAAEIRARADCFRDVGGGRARPSIVAPLIRDDALDVLVYPELGMDHTTFALAALRLAPRQLCGWGHPTTSGLATIDGFVSCADMERPQAQDHYTEPLHVLPGIGTRYRPDARPAAAAREALGLPGRGTLFLCPQSLFKIHPDNDDLFAAVLAALPDAVLVMFDGRHARPTSRFLSRIGPRLARVGAAPDRQLLVLPTVAHATYLQINQACDAMLDTLHWSGGNTSLDALQCRLPIVTMDGDLMRGRQSAAMLRMLGVPELVAADAAQYVTIASRLASERDWRDHLAARIGAGHACLFDAPAPVEAFASLLLGGDDDRSRARATPPAAAAPAAQRLSADGT